MSASFVNISTLRNRSIYLLLPVLVGILTAIASVPFIATAADSSAPDWSGWAPLTTIVVLSPTDEFLDQAATELDEHLEQIAGHTWNISYSDIPGPAIRLVVDPINANLVGRNNDSVHLLTDSSGITITGKTSIAARHGAYILLEDLGVRWLYSTDDWTNIPSSLDPLTAGLDKTEEPFFTERGLGNPVGYMALIPGAVHDRDDWRARNRLDGWDQYTARHSWYDFADKSEVATEDPTAVCYKPDGITPQQVLPDHQVVIDRALAYARDWFDNDPTGGRRMAVPISPSDGHKIWCDEWRVDGEYHFETISNYVFELTNVVARMLQDEYPGKYASVLSYSNYSDVPTIPLEPNVYVQITTFARGSQTLEERLDGFAEKDVFIGYYDYFDVWPWWKDRVPPPGKIDELIPGIDHAANNDLRTFYAEGSDGWAPKGRLYWMTTRLLWDPTLESVDLLDEFYVMAFGPASVVMDRFYTRFDTQTHDNRVWGLAFKDLDEALNIAVTAGDNVVAERIRQTILHTYFWWRWSAEVESDHTAFTSSIDAQEFYTFLSQVTDLRIITGRSHDFAMRDTLENTYGLTVPQIDALKDTAVPHTPAEVQTLLDDTIATWSGQQLVDAVTVSVNDTDLVPLGDSVMPVLAPLRGFDFLEIVVPAAEGETIDADVDLPTFSADDTVDVYDPNGTLVHSFAVSYDWCTCPISFNAAMTGNYRLKTGYHDTRVTLERGAAVDLSRSGKMGKAADGYFYVPEGTPGLIISVDVVGNPINIVSPDGTSVELNIGSAQFGSPQPGPWKLEIPTSQEDNLNVIYRDLQITGVAPLLWHDPNQLLIPAESSPPPRPIAADDAYSTHPESLLVVESPDGLLANDSDPDEQMLQIELETSPTNGVLTLDSTAGTFTYDPDLGFSGVDTFTYRATNGFNYSEIATVTISVGIEVSGDVSLQVVATGGASFIAIAPTVTLISEANGESITVPITPDGTFTISGVIPGTYTIKAMANGFQMAERTGMVVSDADIAMPAIELKIGLVNGDTQIDGPDLSLVVGSYGFYTSDRTDSFSNWVDLNGDGAVSALDISPVIANIGLWGTQPW